MRITLEKGSKCHYEDAVIQIHSPQMSLPCRSPPFLLVMRGWRQTLWEMPWPCGEMPQVNMVASSCPVASTWSKDRRESLGQWPHCRACVDSKKP